MDKIERIESVSRHDRFYGQENLHPLVSVIDFSEKFPRVYASKMIFGFYAVYLKDVQCGDIKYGRDTYDYQDRTLVFVAPEQVIHVNIHKDYKPQDFALLFHPDLIRGTPLGRHMDDYTFFSYESREALHSKTLIASNIGLFLNYCVRFYDRQFVTRAEVNRGNLEKFERLLRDYFHSDKPQTMGLPTVTWCAEQLHLSPNYFGDMVKKESGKTALEYIQLKVIDLAKEKIWDKYPQHFTRAFKKSTGYTPQEYRHLN